MLMRIVVGSVLVLMLAGCGVGERPRPAATSPTAVAPPARYATTAAMRDALAGTGAACPDYSEVTAPTGPGVLGRAECGNTRALSVYDNQSDAQAGVSSACTPGTVFVVGVNWTVNAASADEAEATRRVLGGQIEPC